MLYDFLREHHDEILRLCRNKARATIGAEVNPDILLDVFPQILDRITAAMRESSGEGRERIPDGAEAEKTATLVGSEYTASQIIGGYGVICRTVTQLLKRHDIATPPKDFGVFNRVIDRIIAESILRSEQIRSETSTKEEARRLGSLAHELRNSLTAATAAFSMIQEGIVGPRGETGTAVEAGLRRMRDIIDRSLASVRLHSGDELYVRPLRLIEVIDQVAITLSPECEGRKVKLSVQADPDLVIEADEHHLLSAISNVANNAVKFTRQGSTVTLRARLVGEEAVIEVEDECGGLPPGSVEKLFDPFVHGRGAGGGMGLGLSITRRAVELHGGRISGRDLPGKGCVFTIALPKVPVKEPAAV